MKSKLSPSMENYLESIYELGQEYPMVRVKDIAHKLNVKMSSVTSALQNLAKNKLVNYMPYQHITLTENGGELARRIHNRHIMLTSFITVVLEVTPDIAEVDACKLEHVLSQETIYGLLKFMVRHHAVNLTPQDITVCLEEIKREEIRNAEIT